MLKCKWQGEIPQLSVLYTEALMCECQCGCVVQSLRIPGH